MLRMTRRANDMSDDDKMTQEDYEFYSHRQLVETVMANAVALERLRDQLDRANASKLRIQRDSDRESKCERDESEYQCDACARCYQRVSEQIDRAKVIIDNVIDAWHESPGDNRGLHEALGMTVDEYNRYFVHGLATPKPAEPRPMSEAPLDDDSNENPMSMGWLPTADGEPAFRYGQAVTFKHHGAGPLYGHVAMRGDSLVVVDKFGEWARLDSLTDVRATTTTADGGSGEGE